MEYCIHNGKISILSWNGSLKCKNIANTQHYRLKAERCRTLASNSKKMKTIKELLDIVIASEDEPQISKAIDFHKGVPTLKNGVYRKLSPMLKVRYELLGKWLNATHGDWLDTEEMEILWSKNVADKRLSGIARSVRASMDNWEDHATGLFAPNRISIFAASDNGYEMICLIWFDGTEEPELWVYDCNGESRYKDLASYLQAYIDDDVSASEIKWKLADM